MTFGKWSLALFSLILLGVFIVEYIIPALAINPPTKVNDINVTLIHPTTNAYTNGANFTYNVSWNTVFGEPKNCTLFGNFTGTFASNITNATVITNNTYNVFNATQVTDGLYIWNVYCYNATSHGNYSDSNYTVTVDLTNPLINYVYPTNGGYFNSTNVNFNVSLTEQNLNTSVNVTVYWKEQGVGTWTSNTAVCYGTAPNYRCNVTVDVSSSVGEGNTTQFFYNTTDLSGRTNSTGTESSPLTAKLDTIQPGLVTALKPTGNYTTLYYNTTALVFNWTAPTGDASGIKNYKIYVRDNLGSYLYNGTNNSVTGYQFTGADAHNYTVNVTAVDNANNENTTGTVSVMMTVDITKPFSPTSVAFAADPSTSYDDDGALVVNWTAPTDATSGIKNYKIYVRDNLGSYLYNGTNNSEIGYEFTGSNGRNYTVNVTAVDNANNENTTGGVSSTTITVDTSAPGSVTGLAPTGNYTTLYYNTTALVFNWTAPTGDASGIQNYNIYVWDNRNTSGYLYWGTNNSETGYQFTGADAHNYSVNVTAVDNVNYENSGTTSVTMTVDITPPGLVTALKPTGNYTTLYYNTTALVFNWTAPTDATSGIKNYKIYVRDNLGSYLYNGTNNSVTGYQFTGADAHNYTVNVTAVDNANNENTTGTVSVMMTVDITKPFSPTSVAFAADPSTSYDDDGALVVNWTAPTDATSGIKNYKIYVRDNLGSYLYNGTNNSEIGYEFTGSNGRNYTVNVTAVDNANNENTTGGVSSTTITVDITDPIINNPTPVNGSYFNNPLSVLFQVSLTEQNLNTAVNVTVYYRKNEIGSYQSDSLVCYNSAPSYICNKTKNVDAIVGNNQVLQFFFNTTDSAGRMTSNGTQTSPLTATADTKAPTYVNNDDNVTTIKVGDPVLIYANWTDNQNLAYAWLWTNETGATGKNWTANYSSPIYMVGNATRWSNFTWQNSSVSAGTVVGWMIYVNDSAGNENATSTGTFTTDSTKPQYYSNGTNVTQGTIAKNTPIYIYFNWTDNVGLGYAWLSTNETGAWVNYSSTGRIVDINLTSTQTWSNFTWQNTSVSPGQRIAIKVYANDTSGNENVSDSMIWTIDNAKPTYTNNGTSVASGSTIVKGISILIYANWTDLELSGWWVEHNASVSLSNTTFNTTFDTGNWTNYTITATASAGGLIQARIFVNDTSGNENYTIPTWNWTIDGNAPTYANKSDSVSGAAVYTPGKTYILNISWTDNLGDGNVSKVLLNFSGSATNYTSATTPDVKTLGASNYSVTLTDLGFGNYTYKWYANDTSGNWNETVVYTLNITQNTTNPIIMYLTNSTTTYNNTNISISAGNTATINGTFIYPNTGTMALYSNVTTATTTDNVTLTNVSNSSYTTLSSLRAGVYTFIANTTGNVNYTANATGPGTFYLTVTADVTPPTVLLYDYANATVKKSGASLTLNISVSDATGVNNNEPCNVTIAGVTNQTITYSNGWCNGTITVPTVGSDSSYTINITVKDNATTPNVGINASYVLTVDNTTPVVTITFPTSGSYNKSSSGGYIWINGTVYDLIQMGTGNVTINSTYFNASANLGPYSFNGTNNTAFAFRNQTAVPDGYYAVKINYTDNATNTGEATVYFYVDNTPPTSFTAITTGTKVKNSSQTVQVNVTDNLMTNASITLYYYRYGYDASWQTITMTGTPSVNTTYSVNINTDVLGITQVGYYVVGTDNATNSFSTSNGTATSPLGNFTVGDTTAPSITLTSPSGTITDNTPTLVVNTSESGYCKYDTADKSMSSMTYAMTGSGTGHEATLSILTDNYYTYHVRCNDTYGNEMSVGTTIAFDLDTMNLFNITKPDTKYSYFNASKWGSFALPLWTLQTTTLTYYNVTSVLSSVNGNYNNFYADIGANSTWRSYVPGRPANSFTDFTYNGTHAIYYIYMNTTDRIEIN